MKTKLLLALAALASVSSLMVGCASHADGATTGNEDDVVTRAARDPLAMPAAIIKYENANGWGQMHLEWHTVRQWDLLGDDDLKYAMKQGWERADVQEGAKGNGLEFLAMHRVMLRHLIAQFPQNKDLFAGWTAPPTNPHDAKNPLPNHADTPMDINIIKGIDAITNHIDQFKSDDDLGLYIETKLRPTSSNPSAQVTDKSAGAHNYLHNRWSDDNSPINLGDPTVNLGNQMFWRLHGWIDARWTAYRAAKGLKETDADYQAALQKGEDMFAHGMAKSVALGAEENAGDDAPPMSLRTFFENEDD